jgi:hypothetical protein
MSYYLSPSSCLDNQLEKHCICKQALCQNAMLAGPFLFLAAVELTKCVAPVPYLKKIFVSAMASFAAAAAKVR